MRLWSSASLEMISRGGSARNSTLWSRVLSRVLSRARTPAGAHVQPAAAWKGLFGPESPPRSRGLQNDIGK